MWLNILVCLMMILLWKFFSVWWKLVVWLWLMIRFVCVLSRVIWCGVGCNRVLVRWCVVFWLLLIIEVKCCGLSWWLMVIIGRFLVISWVWVLFLVGR